MGLNPLESRKTALNFSIFRIYLMTENQKKLYLHLKTRSMRCLFVIILFTQFVVFRSEAQKAVPKGYFRSPLDIPLLLSGNFAELRGNHFHSGLDIKTKGAIGKKIYAVAEGYVSRIKVSPVGYGKSIYLTHPNGYVSVYAHCNRFNDSIGAFVKSVQYKKQKFSVDIYLPKNRFPVEKGTLIAYSGNSGSSGGPHLHFEIRDQVTEHAINPQLFGFDIPDTRKPVIYKLAVFPLSEQSRINRSDNKKIYPVSGSNGNFTIRNKVLNLSGEIGFGVQVNDFYNGTHNKCGLYSLKLFVDSELVFHHQLDEFSFFETRYINSLLDYESYKKKRLWIQKLFVEPNNNLSTYKEKVNRGIVEFSDNKLHKIRIEAEDLAGNKSFLSFDAKFSAKKEAQKKIQSQKKQKNYTMVMPFEKDNFIIKDDVRVLIFKNSLYDKILFTYDKSKAPQNGYSALHHIGENSVPVHEAYVLSIKGNEVPEAMRDKALIAGISDRGYVFALGGKWINGFISVRTRYFGKFFITLDTVPPRIQAYGFRKNKTNWAKQKKIQFLISDNLSGIASYNAYIDGNWVLLDYDRKKRLVTHYFDEHTEWGKEHEFVLSVADDRKNTSEFRFRFFR